MELPQRNGLRSKLAFASAMFNDLSVPARNSSALKVAMATTPLHAPSWLSTVSNKGVCREMQGVGWPSSLHASRTMSSPRCPRRRQDCRHQNGLRGKSRGGIANGCFQCEHRGGSQAARLLDSSEPQRSLEPTPPPTALRQFWACQESHTSSRDMPQTSLRRLSGPLSHRGRDIDWRCAMMSAKEFLDCMHDQRGGGPALRSDDPASWRAIEK